MLKDYSTDVQRLFLEMMLEDAQSYVRVQNIYNPQNFDKSQRCGDKAGSISNLDNYHAGSRDQSY